MRSHRHVPSIGGLTMLTLAVLPRREPGELAAVVPGYSKPAAVSVTAILAAGLVPAWQIVGSYDALLHTSYGHLLLLRTGVLAVVLAAAWCRTAGHRSARRRRLREDAHGLGRAAAHSHRELRHR
nr:CopD family protein [Streptomyces sp. NBC_00886]